MLNLVNGFDLGIALVPLVFNGSKSVWDFNTLVTFEKFCSVQQKNMQGVLRYLLEKQRLRTLWSTSGYVTKPPTMSQLLNELMHDSDAFVRLPSTDQQWKVDLGMHFGLPGTTKIPDEILFGLDLSVASRLDMELVVIAKNGDRVYKDKAGKVTAEGYPTPRIPAIEAWGKALQIWVNSSNWESLKGAWKAPPAACPFEWYEKWGNKQYNADGTAIRPDAKLRPPVVWLEMLNAKETG
jgi:hypothetical protein